MTILRSGSDINIQLNKVVDTLELRTCHLRRTKLNTEFTRQLSY